jgi:hypothetical protein
MLGPVAGTVAGVDGEDMGKDMDEAVGAARCRSNIGPMQTPFSRFEGVLSCEWTARGTTERVLPVPDAGEAHAFEASAEVGRFNPAIDSRRVWGLAGEETEAGVAQLSRATLPSTASTNELLPDSEPTFCEATPIGDCVAGSAAESGVRAAASP